MTDFLSTVIPPVQTVNFAAQNPRVVLIYGGYKIGKSAIASWLTLNRKALWLDYEGGSEFLPGRKLDVARAAVLAKSRSRVDFLRQIWRELDVQTPREFDYLVHDKLDNLEDWAERWATAAYRNTVIGKNFGGDSVLELDKGGGYIFLREKFKTLWSEANRAAKFTVFFASLRDKQIDKMDSTVSSNDLDLTGKVRKIAAGFADAIGYLYREVDGSNWLSFVTSDKGTFAGSRCPRLEGQRFRFSWMEGTGTEKRLVVDWGRLFVETPELASETAIETPETETK